MSTTNLSYYDKESIPSGENYRFALVVSDWNAEITHNMEKAAKETLLDLGVLESNIRSYHVPGSFELIFATHKSCKSEYWDGVIAIGSVIRGETAHFDYVCEAVSQGIKDCNVLTQTPAIFCLLTDDTLEQAQARSGGKLGNKGVEAAVTAVRMARLRRVL